MRLLSRQGFVTATVIALTGPALGQTLPDGQGKEVVEAKCNGCHQFLQRVGNGYTPEGWHTVMRMMVNQGTALSDEELAIATDYLIKNFPEKNKAQAALIPGPAEVTMKVWQVPTPGSRPHDPLAAADGSLWYTGQMANVLGRINPKTGKIKEYPLKTPHSGPHGLVEDKDGNIWYTGNTGAHVGKLNPKNGDVTEYKMPDPEAKDPHTLIFDKAGILWFTVQNANRIGRLDPKSGDIKLVTPPTAKSRPYGMAINSKGDLYVVQFGVNSVARVNTKTNEIK